MPYNEVVALASVAHRTITGLDGNYPPAPSGASWLSNPGGKSKARFYTNVVVRGTTVLADAPSLTFLPLVRNKDGSYMAYGTASAGHVRPRLQDVSSIKFQKTVDDGVSYTDYSAEVIDNSAATGANLNDLNKVSNGDWVVVGGPEPFCGACIDMDAANVNANASVLTAKYWNGSDWAALSNVTDGTIAVAGKTLSGDGQITWDVPSDWAASTINGITAYWVQLSVSLALSAAVEVEECDLLFPIKAVIDVDADGDDVMLLIKSQDASVTGTVAYSGTIRASWR
jgi:hypothetical protein